jgi:hypothetical protein
MNKDYLLSHLGEAAEQLVAIIERTQTDPLYEIGEFTVEMGHVYHHLNTAWNGRNCTDEEWSANRNFHAWRKFPESSELLL